MAEKLTNYDPTEDLASDEARASYMAEAFATNDASYIAHALGIVARAKGMTQVAGQTGLSREQLYRSFSENGNPNRKRIWVAPSVPSWAVSPRCMALRTT